MREMIGKDLFEFDTFCITTNGFVKGNGACVMGRGCAKTARDRYIGIDLKIGKYITKYGNRCFNLGMYDGKNILTFVVKHKWFEEADIELIKLSCKQITEMADKFNLSDVAIPRPGCGNGKLKWTDVKPIIEPLLDDRFIIVHK